jgi:carbamoylphosphate synthase large subunit
VEHKKPNRSNSDSNRPKVLLTNTDRWPIAARLAIGLSNAGCQVFAVCPKPGHPLLKTRGIDKVFQYSGLHPLETLLAAIEQSDPDIVIPCDDRGVQHLHELHAQAIKQGERGAKILRLITRSLGDPESYPIVSGRDELLRVAHEEGIRIPATQVIHSLEDVKEWAGKQPFPWVLKADGTCGGRGVRIAETSEQAAQFFLQLTRPPGAMSLAKKMVMNRNRSWSWPGARHSKPAVIAQSLIQGRPANCAVVCEKGTVLGGIGVEVVSAQGWKGPATVVRVVDNREMMDAAKKIACRLGLSGFFGLDFMIEEGTGAVYLIEMNPRCTPLCHLQLGVGRDMVGALYAHLFGRTKFETSSLTEKEIIAYFPQAWTYKSQFVDSSFQDIPQGEPELIEALLHPWSERSLMGRAVDMFRRWFGEERIVEDCVFSDAILGRDLVAISRQEKVEASCEPARVQQTLI